MCVAAPLPAQDRAVAQVSPGVSHSVPVLLYSLDSNRETEAAKCQKLVAWNTALPPLAVGSPPQSKLRVWLL